MAPSPRPDRRSPEAQAYRRLYKTSRWSGKHGVRAQQLKRQPLCEICLKAGRYTRATVCDHVDPKSKGTEAGFFRGPFQSLCATCHDGMKQRAERLGFEPGCDVSGRPIDPFHPWNARR